MFAIYDTMSYIRPDINTICLGQAASAAAVLLAAGTPGKRLALPHSRVIIHQPYSGAQGQASDVELAAKEIMRLKSALEGVLSQHTGQTIEKIQTDTDRDFVMTSDQAMEYGIIDEILTPRAVVDNTGAIRAASA
jgi:ATP-dependent Clp protease protease subunit